MQVRIISNSIINELTNGPRKSTILLDVEATQLSTEQLNTARLPNDNKLLHVHVLRIL